MSIDLVVVILVLMISVILHEVAHGLVALIRGDDTAKRLGRLTLNPLKHIDPFGTVILPAMLYLSTGFSFGYAKPVPVDFNRLYRKRLDSALVAFAGPMVNIVLAFLAVHFIKEFDLQTKFFFNKDDLVLVFLRYMLIINIVLTIFNLIPILPLDGGRIMSSILPNFIRKYYAASERWGMFILLGFIFIVPFLGRILGFDFNIYQNFMQKTVNSLLFYLLF